MSDIETDISIARRQERQIETRTDSIDKDIKSPRCRKPGNAASSRVVERTIDHEVVERCEHRIAQPERHRSEKVKLPRPPRGFERPALDDPAQCRTRGIESVNSGIGASNWEPSSAVS